MSRAERILAAVMAADLAEEQRDYHRAAELMAQVERELSVGVNDTMPGLGPARIAPAPVGRYSITSGPGRYSKIRPRG